MSKPMSGAGLTACLVAVCTVSGLTSGVAGAYPSGRPCVSLDGAWSFRHAPDDRGESERWYASTDGGSMKVTVPGCWDTQGVGATTNNMRHNAPGVGWYRRTFETPPKWTGKRVWLVVGGAHRAAQVWVNGRPAGEHRGYPTAFRLDITDLLRPSGVQQLDIAVDSRRHHPDLDSLFGGFDVMDYMDVIWGGIFGHVSLEATDTSWFGDVFVVPDPARRRASVKVRVDGRPGQYEVTCTVRKAAGDGKPVGPSVRAGMAGAETTLDLDLPRAPLWTPETPKLLVADVQLRRAGKVVDRRTVRFGMRRMEVRGSDFYLNGERYYLRGYGDDWTFPQTIYGLPDVPSWREYLSKRTAYGLNYVRHHSTMPPDDYLDAADEVGMLVQPELPIVYEHYLQEATPRTQDLYRQVWRDYIVQMRNHPSVLSWCTGNEQWNGYALSQELCREAKQLDPTRPVMDSDGVWPGVDRPTLDYLSVQFDEGAIPWGSTIGKYHLAKKPTKPVIVHEMSNLSVLPNPDDADRYTGIRPFWLEAMAQAVEKQGLRHRLNDMRTASARLQASLLKLNIEAARLSPDTDGHQQWLVRDFWNQSTGFLDQFDAEREISVKDARRYLSPAVLLWERNRASFACGEAIPIRLFVSDFRSRSAARVSGVRFRLGGGAWVWAQGPIAGGQRGVIGPWTAPLRAPAFGSPRMLVVEGQVLSAGGRVIADNSWKVWVFPAVSGSPAPGEGVRVVRRLTPKVVADLEAGARVLVTNETAAFPTIQARFKTAWWHGDDNGDHVYGNMVDAHPALAGFPTEGFGDLQMVGMMDNRPVVLVDQVPGTPEPIVWSLDVPWLMRRKAYLFEARVGHGALLVSTLNLSKDVQRTDPAAAWLHDALVRYVSSAAFQPAAEIPVEWLRSRAYDEGLPDSATWTEGFARLVSATGKPQPWYTWREDRATTLPVRQTDGKQSITWTTAPAPASGSATVTFAWTGGMGWESEPAAGGFTLTVNGKRAMEFPFSVRSGVWRDAATGCELHYVVRRTVGPDSFGIFLLTVPASLCTPGQPVQLGITAGAGNSQRWFSLVPYTDTVQVEREP